jgi:KDO2-lipid IV(A) lauroyltransferase
LYYFLNTLSFLITAVGKRGQSILARGFAIVSFRIFGIRRDLIMSNLRKAFGDQKTEAELKQLGYDSTVNFLSTIFEFLGSHDGSVANDVEIQGEQHLLAALAQGKGVYVLCCHMGSWEAMGGAMTKRFGPTYVIVKKVGSPGVDRFVGEMRTRNRFMTIARKGKGTASESIRAALGKNEIVGFVMDQARPSEPKFPFFGHPAKTNTGFAAIWRKNPAPILSAHAERIGFGRHIIKIHPSIELTPTEDLARDVDAFTNRFNQEVEMIVKCCPSQYFWMHNRWKN